MDKSTRHFYQMSYSERLVQIQSTAQLSTQQMAVIQQMARLNNQTLIENYLTDYGLPEGIAVNFKINGRSKMVPMVTEEPSVIAAASNGAKIMGKNGIQAIVLNRLLTGQIIINQPHSEQIKWIQRHQADLITIANQSHPNLLNYGGGAERLQIRRLDTDNYSVDLLVNVGEAMGANTMNTMLEAVGHTIDDQFNDSVLMQILSNYATSSIAQARARLDVSELTTKSMNGKIIAKRIALASHIAQVDPFRATTHNKGIMNGVDAVVMAMGNDWRAIESGVHAFAARDGQYRGLSQWQLDGDQLIGTLQLPLPVGFVGGATKLLPLVKINHQIADIHSARELMELIVSVGLAQNLAALRAIVTDGIQRGHMHLQLKSLARSNGATTEELPLVLAQLRKLQHPQSSDVKNILEVLRKKGS